jgi:HB1, ASXL, restriction endonuclease HTH domain
MPSELTWGQAIQKVLGESPEPMHYADITDRIVKDGLRQNLGATPAATVIATLATSIKHKGKKSPFVRVSKGTYDLAKRSAVAPSAITVEGSGIVGADAEEQYAIVAAFGMFWRREAVDWMRTTKLLGMQQIGATPVDFNGQRGVYLLYDGREVIYVGRATDRALGTRLYEHTIDRLSARWDRFSWFGLLPVSNTGSLGKMPDTFDAAKLGPALEAILVEALEPRQNRKRGDDLAAVEYVQMEDPEIEKRRARAVIDRALNKA